MAHQQVKLSTTTQQTHDPWESCSTIRKLSGELESARSHFFFFLAVICGDFFFFSLIALSFHSWKYVHTLCMMHGNIIGSKVHSERVYKLRCSFLFCLSYLHSQRWRQRRLRPQRSRFALTLHTRVNCTAKGNRFVSGFASKKRFLKIKR